VIGVRPASPRRPPMTGTTWGAAVTVDRRVIKLSRMKERIVADFGNCKACRRVSVSRKGRPRAETFKENICNTEVKWLKA